MLVKFTKALAGQNDLVAYVDAIGELDGTRCLLDRKTTGGRYPEEPIGLLALDPQLVCYSWVTGMAEVAQVVFVRKRPVAGPVRADQDRRDSGLGAAV